MPTIDWFGMEIRHYVAGIRYLVVGFRYWGWVAIASELELVLANESTVVHSFQVAKW